MCATKANCVYGTKRRAQKENSNPKIIIMQKKEEEEEEVWSEPAHYDVNEYTSTHWRLQTPTPHTLTHCAHAYTHTHTHTRHTHILLMTFVYSHSVQRLTVYIRFHSFLHALSIIRKTTHLVYSFAFILRSFVHITIRENCFAIEFKPSSFFFFIL